MASTYLSRTSGTPTSQKIGTFSLWIKRSELVNGGTEQWFASGNSSTTDINNRWNIKFTGSDNIELFNVSSSSTNMRLQTNRVFKDVNAWYHIVFTVDTTQATASDRLKMWVNGVQETSFSASTYPSLDDTSCQFFQSGKVHRIGAFDGSGTYPYYLSALIAHYHYTDGTAYDASTFGESDANGVWTPKTAPSVTYGNNGFFLKFENSGSMGTDSSPNGNNFTVNGNLTQTVDTPSNVYCTMNPLDNYRQQATLSNGNTSVTTGSSQSTYTRGTLGMSAGKWYWEMKMTNSSPLGNLNFGIVNAPSDDPAQRLRGASTTNSVAATDYNYAIYANGVSTGINGEIVAQNDIVIFAFDADNNALYIGKNGSWYNSGDPTSGASKTGGFTPGTAGLDYFPAIGDENGSAGYSVQFNFGNGYFGTTPVSSAGSNGNGSIFEYDVPTGYYALNTKNLATYG